MCYLKCNIEEGLGGVPIDYTYSRVRGNNARMMMMNLNNS